MRGPNRAAIAGPVPRPSVAQYRPAGDIRTDADLDLDPETQTLTVRVHSFANPRSNRTIQHLLDCLNQTQFTYPATTLRLRYTLADLPRK